MGYICNFLLLFLPVCAFKTEINKIYRHHLKMFCGHILQTIIWEKDVFKTVKFSEWALTIE